MPLSRPMPSRRRVLLGLLAGVLLASLACGPKYTRVEEGGTSPRAFFGIIESDRWWGFLVLESTDFEACAAGEGAATVLRLVDQTPLDATLEDLLRPGEIPCDKLRVTSSDEIQAFLGIHMVGDIRTAVDDEGPFYLADEPSFLRLAGSPGLDSTYLVKITADEVVLVTAAYGNTLGNEEEHLYCMACSSSGSAKTLQHRILTVSYGE